MVTFWAAAAPTALPGVSDLLVTGGVVGVLAFMVIGFIRGWIITPGRFQDMVADRDSWRDAYDKQRAVNEKNSQVADQSLAGINTAVTLLNQIRNAQSPTVRRSGRREEP